MLGGVGEVLAGLVPDMFGEAGEMLMVLHRQFIVRLWVVLQGLISLPLGWAFVRGGWDLTRGKPSRRLRVAAIVLFGLTLASQVLLGLFVYPNLGDLPLGQSPAVWIATLAGAAVGPLAVSAVCLVVTRHR